jgi:hypothetical protein
VFGLDVKPFKFIDANIVVEKSVERREKGGGEEKNKKKNRPTTVGKFHNASSLSGVLEWKQGENNLKMD